jgi:hypothetical protein
VPDPPAGADAAWVGIGGVRSHDLMEVGPLQTASRRLASKHRRLMRR